MKPIGKVLLLITLLSLCVGWVSADRYSVVERDIVVPFSAENVTATMNETHMRFETSYLNESIELIDFFVPDQLQDDLVYVTPCDTANGFYCQGTDGLFHIKTDPLAGEDRFYALTDYLFDYETGQSDGVNVSEAVPFQIYSAAQGNVVTYAVGDLTIYDGSYYRCKQAIFNYNGVPPALTQYWEEVQPQQEGSDDVPAGFGWTRINQEVSLGYRSDNAGGKVFTDFNSSGIHYGVYADGADVIINYTYMDGENVSARYNRTLHGNGSGEVIADDRIVFEADRKSTYNCDEFGDCVPTGEVVEHAINASLSSPTAIITDSFVIDDKKFGANYTADGEWHNFTYAFESTLPIEWHRGHWRFDMGTSQSWVLDVSDICGEQNNCTYRTSSGDRVYTLYVDFVDNDGQVDPTYNLSIDLDNDAYLDGTLNQGNWSYLDFNESGIYTSLVGYWNADIDSTYAVDLKGDNDGSFSGNTHTDDGIYDKSYVFDGNADYIYAGIIPIDSWDSLTFSAWVNSESTDSARYISILYNPTDDVRLYQATGGYPRFGVDDGSADDTDGTTNIANTGWRHLVGVWNGSHVLLYLDGSLKNTDSATFNPSSADGYTYFSKIGTGNYIDGNMDEIMIFNTSLTASQISDIYNNQSARFQESGNLSVKAQDIDMNNSYNRIDLTVNDYKTDYNTNISARIGYWDVDKGYNTSDEGLVGYWHFDEDYLDYSGQENHGTAYDDTYINASGVWNGTAVFDGVGDYLELTDINLTEGTISLWAYNNFDDDLNFLYSSGEMDMRINTAGTITITVYNDTDSNFEIIDGLTLLGGRWYHLAMTYDKSQMKFYSNGILYESNSQITGELRNFEFNNLVGSNTGVANFHNGSIDEIMVYNRSLSADEVKELYIKGKANFDYTDYQTFQRNGTTNASLPLEFAVDNTTTKVLPEFRHSGSFYTSFLDFQDYITLLSYNNVTDTVVPNITNVQLQEYGVNVTSCEVGANCGLQITVVDDSCTSPTVSAGFVYTDADQLKFNSTSWSLQSDNGSLCVFKTQTTQFDQQGPYIAYISYDDGFSETQSSQLSFDVTDQTTTDKTGGGGSGTTPPINDTGNVTINVTGNQTGYSGQTVEIGAPNLTLVLLLLGLLAIIAILIGLISRYD